MDDSGLQLAWDGLSASAKIQLMKFTVYRNSNQEQARTSDLLRLMPEAGQHALDIGARDGYFSVLMADRFERITALDLTKPSISNPKVHCVSGNATAMEFEDNLFDFVFCAEVLEHIPSDLLLDACREIERVAASQIVIGVPYKQDTRVGRTTCNSCGHINPPWGHVNTFDEHRLAELFPNCEPREISFVGQNFHQTNALSTSLMDFAGNPYGTYDQDEPCIRCGRALLRPPRRNPAQLVATKLAFWSRWPTQWSAKKQGNWIHMKLQKKSSL